MIDIVGIIVGLIIGSVLLLVGNSIPDQNDVILQHKDQLTNLGNELWACDQDTQCQKTKNNSISAINTSLNTIEISQNLRNNLMMWGIIIDGLMVVAGFIAIRSR